MSKDLMLGWEHRHHATGGVRPAGGGNRSCPA